MSNPAWKQLQRRIVRAWGGEPAWVGDWGSDGRRGAELPVALEVTRNKNRCVTKRKLEQAELQGKLEGKPWVLVVAGHNDRAPLAVCSHSFMLALARQAGRIAGDPALEQEVA